MADQNIQLSAPPRALGNRVIITPDDFAGNESLTIHAGFNGESPQTWELETARLKLVADGNAANRYTTSYIYADERLGRVVTGIKSVAITAGQTKTVDILGLCALSSTWVEGDFYVGFSRPMVFWGAMVLVISVTGGLAGDLISNPVITLRYLNRLEAID